MLERDVLRQITDWLTAEKIFWLRMNSGAMFGKHKGKSWAVRFGEKGMADILALPQRWNGWDRLYTPTWIEVKNEKGVQSDDQKAFQARVEAEGHRYVLARGFQDVAKELRG